MSGHLSNEAMVERLVEAGWTRDAAEDEVRRTLEDAAEEDGF